MSYSQYNFGDPMPPDSPKLLNKYKAFRVVVGDSYKEDFVDGLPIIPLTKNMKSKSLKALANDKISLKVGELIRFLRYEARFNQYIFSTDDNVEIVLADVFISKNFLFPINLSR